MKKIYKIIVTVLFLSVFSCGGNNDNNETSSPICGVPPYEVGFSVNAKAEKYKDFLNKEGEFDTKNVYFYYKTDDNHEERIYIPWGNKRKAEDERDVNKYIFVIWQSKIDPLFTGKEEVLYLANNGKKIMISLIGIKSENDKCGGYIYNLKKVKVNGKEVKIKSSWRFDIVNLIE